MSGLSSAGSPEKKIDRSTKLIATSVTSFMLYQIVPNMKYHFRIIFCVIFRMLETFVEVQRNKGNDLNVTYLVGGKVKEEEESASSVSSFNVFYAFVQTFREGTWIGYRTDSFWKPSYCLTGFLLGNSFLGEIFCYANLYFRVIFYCFGPKVGGSLSVVCERLEVA